MVSDRYRKFSATGKGHAALLTVLSQIRRRRKEISEKIHVLKRAQAALDRGSPEIVVKRVAKQPL